MRHGIRDNESIEIRRTFVHPKFDFPSLYNDIVVSELGNYDSAGHGTASQPAYFYNLYLLNIGGQHKTSGYMQYVPVILPDVPAGTTFIELYEQT